jgi:acyl transferase domain-containing protein/NAD(P)H-dependent flavin oxidoreductase YrpB (nitropropane dioxygenase family)/NAD(P)-dependent dehydrogenase (short-subunit alcohol dehydrogenase family)
MTVAPREVSSHGSSARFLTALATVPERFRFLAITPFERPDLQLARALLRQQATVAVDIGRDPLQWPTLFAGLACQPSPFLGIRVPDGLDPGLLAIPESIGFVVMAGDSAHLYETCQRFPVIAQVCSPEDAGQALCCGVAGLISKGQESGGLVGDESSFVLVQGVVAAAQKAACPVWCQGGIGLHTAAGAIAGGAFGVVIDSLLAAMPECSLADDIKAQVLAMDGSEVRLLAGYQVYARGGRDISVLEEMDAEEVRAALAGQGAQLLLPIGQDAALVKGTMAECSTLETLLNTLRTRIAGQLRQARDLRPLQEGSPWAVAHGTRYPVAQGPMTRVSDTAEFCGAVAEGGGLPFLALSLMQENACRKLLEATRERVGGQPWGIGVLGFAPPEILNPQLELVKAFKPSVLLLAGGRPSQARPFLDLGIPTYLHVPSPGLLELFLKDGACHFVFEGRECGGHVGPRYSFVLWEQAIAIMLQTERPETLNILFAGGIHDERSSAMVAALAAPLAARGAKIGVLMGTAYIATQEAVSCGSVLQSFQEQALSGERTVLVETAPGHAIRCLPSGFVDLFHREKNLLTKAGIDQKAVWKALEDLTVGRLRIATKGVEHQGGSLVPVDLGRQRAEGMFMIGQAIALKHAVTTIADLHASVTAGATQYLEQMAMPVLTRSAAVEPIAIVGMACIYPGSPDLETYWANIVEGRDLVREVPAERWNAAQYYQAGEAGAGKSPSKWGGFIEDTPFDPLQFGIPPQSLAAIEPVQLLSLEVASNALKDAGYASRYFDREKTAVIFGAESGMDLANQYNFRNLYPQYCGELPAALDQVLPRLTEDSFPGILVNVISGRIANRLGLGGVNYSVDAACASSLTAIELGVKELRGGSSDMVLAGGADFHNGISDFLMFASVGALSASGRCRSFDNSADGIALGEGVGIVVLKRLADAERDGDRIYAVIDGIAGSSDGKGLGLTAPRKEGQKRALERAYWQAGKLPADIGLVEAHGTGTVVGDRTELKTLTEIYNAGGALPGQAGLGSVKSQIGHTKCAAGIAGMIKVAKALHHRVLPPTGQITTPNAWYSRHSSPFSINTAAMPWLGDKSGAAVSAFGFGGTNFHAVLSAYPAHQSAMGAAVLPAELFAFRGASADDVLKSMRLLSDFLTRSTAAVRLCDLAGSVWMQGEGPVQCAFVAADHAGLRQKLSQAMLHKGSDNIVWRSAEPAGKVACLFPGQGSQHPGMLRELFVYFPHLQSILAEGAPYLGVTFPPSAHDEHTRSEQQHALMDTRNAQPALGIVEMAAFEWLRALGLQPDMAAGHSFGELVALASAGVFDTKTLVALARARADAILGAAGDDPGGMAAVSLGAEALQSLLADFPEITLANQNSPMQTVISGSTPAMEAVREFLKDRAVASKLIDTACAFHSPVVADAEPRFAKVLATQAMGSMQWPVYANTTAAPHAADANDIRAELASHIVSPVRFVSQIERMYADGARVFVEIGPRRVLSGLVDKILKHQPHVMVTLDHEGKGLAGMLEAVAQLAVILPAFDAGSLFAGRARELDLASPKVLPATCWMVNGGRAWPRIGEVPAHGGKVVLAPVTMATARTGQAEPAALSEHQLTVMNYLSNMRDVVNAQRDVLMSFLGSPVAIERPVAGKPVAERSVARMATAPAAIAHQVIKAAVVPSLPPAQDFRTVLLGIVSDRTGYPADMLDIDLDMEADLSIDSIKRVEIIGELSEKLAIRNAIGSDADSLLEQLASQKTLRAVLSWLAERLPAAAPASEQPAAVAVAKPQGNVGQLLLDIVAECTGYPVEALDPTLDLEADLSIDSIKRLEIVSQLTARMGVDERLKDKDAMLESLAALKTLKAMIEWLEREAQPVPTATVHMVEDDGAASIPLSRYVMRIIDAPATRNAGTDFSGKKFVITDDSLGLAPRVAELLRRLGADVRVISFSEEAPLPGGLDAIDGLVHLWSLNPANRVRDVKRFFQVVRESVLNRTRYLLVASGLGGDFGMVGQAGAQMEFGRGAGLAGMIKSIVKEFSELRAQWVDMDLSEPVDALAGYIMAELTGENDLTEVAYQLGQRRTRLAVPTDLVSLNTEGLPLDRESVVLITGGARGITARMAIALARRYHCRLELVGRSPEPAGEEILLTRHLKDAREIRQALIGADPSRKPAEVERMTRDILAEREFRATMVQIREAGSPVNYTQIDVRDIDTFTSFIESLYLLMGRIDGVIHGAGVVEDKLVRDKSAESFQRVFDTKVRGALMLNKLIRDDVKFVVFFSSVAGAFGNRGQVDYASANDVLDKLAYAWQNRINGRVLSVNWGPWADTGMVSEALEREYARKGIGLIPQADGVNALLQELASGGRGETQVVLMCGTPESFAVKPTLVNRV